MSTLPPWEALTTVEMEAWIRRDPVVVLPLAAVEQHGPHLPLSTDVDIGRGILEAACGALPDDFPVRVLPPLVVGASAEHEGFPGTLSLEPELLSAVVESLGRGVARQGVRRLVLFNSHGGNRHVADAAGLRLRRDHGLLVVKAHWFRFPRPGGVELPDAEWRHGLHGGAVETAMMLHLHPERVRLEAVRDAPSLGVELERRLRHLEPEGVASFSWLAGDLHPSGITGDPRWATGVAGQRLVEHYGAVLAGVLQDARDFPLDRLTGRREPPVDG
jgi:creatinine amidohydrolase